MLCSFRLLKKVCLCKNQRFIIVLIEFLNLMLCSLIELQKTEKLQEEIKDTLNDLRLKNES